MSEASAIEFPCRFPIKMMGRESATFADTVRTIVEAHAGTLEADDVRTAFSARGNFVSITVTITAMSQAQLDAIYRDASAHDEVLMAL